MTTTPRAYVSWRVVPGGQDLLRRGFGRALSNDRRLRYRNGRVVAGSIWVESRLEDEWRAAVRLAVQEGQIVVAEVRIFPYEEQPDERARGDVAGLWSGELLDPQAVIVPRGGLTARTLRRLRVGDYLTTMQEIVERLSRDHPEVFSPNHSIGALGLRPTPPDEAHRERRPRSDRRPDLFYAALAHRYVRLTERGERRPVRALAARRKVSPGKIRDWLHEARTRGLLTSGLVGRSGGRLTPQAEALLAERRGGKR